MSKLISRIGSAALAVLLSVVCATTAEATSLANQPVFANTDIPGNLALTLSVEFPTAISVANTGNYTDTLTYLGYFDPGKCYTYMPNLASPSSSYFQPSTWATGINQHFCSGMWSGNFMNWAAMPTIDPFRWALTGGYRSVDTPTLTILEKAWGSTQGGVSANYPYRGTSPSTGGTNLLQSPVSISQVTPFSAWAQFNLGIWGNGNAMVFSASNQYQLPASLAINLTDNGAAENGTLASLAGWKVYVRVKVCDATTPLGVGFLEANCNQYPGVSGVPSYKPEGLMQQYSNQIRYSVFGYLDENGDVRQGGALREPMGFIGPTYPVPLSSVLATNTRPEWDPATGVMSNNPDPAAASGSNPAVSQSGVMNYLNKFGEYGQTYKTYDNVSELYYAAVRYYENLGNVPEWTNGATPAAMDGFPAVTNWADPIVYSCQKNFILGIGDDHTWFDYNVGGNTNASGSRPMPATVSGDTFNQASTWTTDLQFLEGITQTPWWPFDSGATYFIAGLAYGVHVNDIRTDLPGAQTISTYWMDVAEDQEVENLNPYYLAAKYGGFKPAGTIAQISVPAQGTDGTPYYMKTPLNSNNKQWDTTGLNVTMNGGNVHPLPDNYFVANNAQAMVTSLNTAFANIAHAASALTTSFSYTAPNVQSSTESFASSYSSKGGWSGNVTASTLTYVAGVPTQGATVWTSDTAYQSQLAVVGSINGWQTGRNIATWDPNRVVGGVLTPGAVPFESGSLSAPLMAALLPSTCVGSSALCESAALSYLRGDQSNEASGTPGTQGYRNRTLLLGDIVNANLTPVNTPIQTFSEANDPGYAAFKTKWTTTTPRPGMVYAGANDGMLHGFVASSGVEQFAYVPSALYLGPNNTPQVDGLAQLTNPNYIHHFYVDATPNVFDVDMNRTGGTGYVVPVNPSVNTWATVLIGGLGKGGKSYYAIDVTDPANMSSESAVASKVLWEFSDPTMGYSYGAAVVVRTTKWGWVAILTSGYNNSDGYGYLYIVNVATGALLEKVRTTGLANGMTQASAYVQDYSNDLTDSVYVGDLNGQLWRFDLTGTPTSYPQGILLATLTDGVNPQPVTSAPLIEIHPVTRQRFVMVGTGKLLASSDITSAQMQTFYAILDGTAGAFNAAPATPINRGNLKQLTDTDLTSTAMSLTPGQLGWYYDLGMTGGIGWRVIVNPQAYNGIVAFSSLLTLTNDPCNPSGNSRVYALDYSTGTSVLAPSQAYASFATAVINIRYTGANGNPEIVVGFSGGTVPFARVPANLTGTLATRILNWREVPTVE